MKYNILLLETIAPEAMAILESADDVVCYIPRDDFSKDSIHGVITRGKGQVNEAFINSLPLLKGIARAGVGVDNIDIPVATSCGVQVLNTPGENASTMAEHTVSLLLMLQRKLYDYATATKNGDWMSRVGYDGDEISGKTLGIIGLGDIGERVGHVAKAFGMEVVYSDMAEKEVPFTKLGFDEVAAQSDIISLHIPLTSGTKGLIDSTFFDKLKEGALLVNTARGGIIDEVALLAALNSGKLGGFASDVLAQEPPPADDPLMKHEKTFITPHVGSLTKATYDRMCVISAENILKLLRGEKVGDRFLYNRV